MATLYPFSPQTAQLLEKMPGPGGTHRWLLQTAWGLNQALPEETCREFLRSCCDQFVTHRIVPDSEIDGIIQSAYGSQALEKKHWGRPSFEWPAPNPEFITQFLSTTPSCFDPSVDTGLEAHDVLPELFLRRELICSGPTTERAMVRPLPETMQDAEWLQFIVVNPMRDRSGINKLGKPSVRCQNNILKRRYLVAEFDVSYLSKDQQAQLITKLSNFAPLIMVVDSGGKSLHAWFRIEHYSPRDQMTFFFFACLLGADPSRWDICGWLRMPGGMRVVDGCPSVRQRIVYFHKEVARG